MIIVPDASVIVKWFISEEYSDKADELRRDYINNLIDIAVPQLLFYEVLNAIKYSAGFSENELLDIGEVLNAYQFITIPLKGDYLRETLKLSYKQGIIIYDASYLAIARVRQGILYTADERLLSKIGEQRYARHIREYRSGEKIF